MKEPASCGEAMTFSALISLDAELEKENDSFLIPLPLQMKLDDNKSRTLTDECGEQPRAELRLDVLLLPSRTINRKSEASFLCAKETASGRSSSSGAELHFLVDCAPSISSRHVMTSRNSNSCNEGFGVLLAKPDVFGTEPLLLVCDG